MFINRKQARYIDKRVIKASDKNNVEILLVKTNRILLSAKPLMKKKVWLVNRVAVETKMSASI